MLSAYDNSTVYIDEPISAGELRKVQYFHENYVSQDYFVKALILVRNAKIRITLMKRMPSFSTMNNCTVTYYLETNIFLQAIKALFDLFQNQVCYCFVASLVQKMNQNDRSVSSYSVPSLDSLCPIVDRSRKIGSTGSKQDRRVLFANFSA